MPQLAWYAIVVPRGDQAGAAAWRARSPEVRAVEVHDVDRTWRDGEGCLSAAPARAALKRDAGAVGRPSRIPNPAAVAGLQVAML